jgi:16S rRNA (cytosine1402-N4)-methyltransferase
MNWLRPVPGETVADCTLGYGGHAMGFLQRISPGGRLVGFDVDGGQLENTRERLAKGVAAGVVVSTHHMNFAGLGNVLAKEGLDGYDVIFADLGISSMQVDDPARGISYKHEGPLDMRMDNRVARTGGDVLATISEKDLSAALWDLADEEGHAKIARWIVQQRQVQPIETTGQLARLVMNAKGVSPRARNKPWQVPGGLHPAAKTFQALRILVNDELGSLRALLRAGPYCLRLGGRIGIISFHSGEDRLVKQAFRDGLRDGTFASVSEHVIVPSPAEVRSNPRSASAKFRWARKK